MSAETELSTFKEMRAKFEASRDDDLAYRGLTPYMRLAMGERRAGCFLRALQR